VETALFRIATTPADILKVHAVRAIVFVEKQHVPYDLEVDEYDQSAVHILGECEGEPIAAGRLRFLGEWAKLERIAIRSAWRGRGYGHQLVEYMLAEARRRGYQRFKMHAQLYLQSFYARHGFRTQGAPFLEAGIEHCLMVREA